MVSFCSSNVCICSLILDPSSNSLGFDRSLHLSRLKVWIRAAKKTELASKADKELNCIRLKFQTYQHDEVHHIC